MEAISEFQLLRPTSLAGVLEARKAHPQAQLAGRRHGSRGQYPPRHRRAAGADRHERRRRAARDQGRCQGPRNRRVGHAGRGGAPSGRARALSRGGAGGRLDRRADASQHGHGRRQPLPRYALHFLQSERMVAVGEQSLPQDHRRDMPRGAEEPRRVLCHLQRRSGAGAHDARRARSTSRTRRASARCP